MNADKSSRSMMFVDGFNLYHPLDEYAERNKANHIKWLNLWALGEIIAKRRQEILSDVIYCTAYQSKGSDAKARHSIYIRALEYYGVKVEMGHYVMVPTKLCSACGMTGEKPTEKQTDINVALSLFRAAMNDQFDVAYLVSVDSDQAATAKHFAAQFPNKTLVSVSPPNKKHSNKLLTENSGHKHSLTIEEVIRARLPNAIMRTDGKPPIVCPREYHQN